jgi:hypothetical protein
MRKRFVCSMPTWLKILAISAVLIPATNSGSFAQYACPPGYAYSGGACQPSGYAPGNPVSGAVGGTAAGAAAGSAAAGPVGGLVGGALGAATGTVAGTANAVTGTVNTVTGAPAYPSYGSGYPPPPAPTCAPGSMLYNGVCYPAAR